MNFLYLIEIISDFSLLFALLNFISSFGENVNNNVVLFTYSILIVCISHIIKFKFNNHKGIEYIPLVLLFVPLIFMGNTNFLIFVCAIFGYSIFYLNKNMIYKSYKNYTYAFEKNFYFIIILIIIALLEKKVGIMKHTVIPYLIIYLILSIAIMRTLRNIKYNNMNKQIAKVTVRFTLGILIVTFVISLFDIKKIIGTFYNKFADVLINNYIVKHILLMVGTFVNFIIQHIVSSLSSFLANNKNESNPDTSFQMVQNGINSNSVFKNQFFIIAIKIIFVVLAIYILIKIMKKHFSEESSMQDYTEINEFILPKNNFLKNIKNNIAHKLKRNDYNYRIRLYYKKYLKMCVKKSIEINKNDTSYDVSQKSYSMFSHQIVDNIRNIYIRVRYSNFKCDKNTFNAFKHYYNKL